MTAIFGGRSRPKARYNAIVVVIYCLFAIIAYPKPEQTPKLNIGDDAPTLANVVWIKGEPVERFERDQIYVVDFWATWCKPCIDMIPHLNNIAKKYGRQVTVIGVSVERGKRPLNETKRIVEAFVRRRSEYMEYSVALDDPTKNAAFRDWLEASAITTIPTAFVIDQRGKVAAIITGQKKQLEAAVEAVLGGKATAVQMTDLLREQRDAEIAYAQRLAESAALRTAESKGDFGAALNAVDAMIAQRPEQEYGDWALWFERIRFCFHISPEKGIESAERLAADPNVCSKFNLPLNRDQLLAKIGGVILAEDGLQLRAYEYAIACIQKTLPQITEGQSRYSALLLLASGYYRLGDLERATKFQSEGIDTAERWARKFNSRGYDLGLSWTEKMWEAREKLKQFQLERENRANVKAGLRQ